MKGSSGAATENEAYELDAEEATLVLKYVEHLEQALIAESPQLESARNEAGGMEWQGRPVYEEFIRRSRDAHQGNHERESEEDTHHRRFRGSGQNAPGK